MWKIKNEIVNLHGPTKNNHWRRVGVGGSPSSHPIETPLSACSRKIWGQSRLPWNSSTREKLLYTTRQWTSPNNTRFRFDHNMDFKPAADLDWLAYRFFRDGWARLGSSLPPLRVLPLCQVTVYLDVAATVAVMRAHADSYVTVLAPLLARWLKRRRKEHGKTCERSEDFSERQLFYVLWFFDPVHAQNHSAVLQRDYKGTSRLFCSSLFFFPSFCVCSPG